MEKQPHPIEDEVSSEDSVLTEETQKIAFRVDRGGLFSRTVLTVELPPTPGLPPTIPCGDCHDDMRLEYRTFRSVLSVFNTVVIFTGIALYTCPSCFSKAASPNLDPNIDEGLDRQWLYMLRIKQRLLNYLWDAERNGKHVDMDEIAELPISPLED